MTHFANVDMTVILHAATIETFNSLIKRGQYHFLPLVVGRYEPKRQSKTSTPSTPIRLGWVTEQSLSFFTLCFVWLTGMWLVKLLPIESIAFSFHFHKYILPSQRKSNVFPTRFLRLFVSIKTLDASFVRFSQAIPIAYSPFLPRSF